MEEDKNEGSLFEIPSLDDVDAARAVPNTTTVSIQSPYFSNSNASASSSAPQSKPTAPINLGSNPYRLSSNTMLNTLVQSNSSSSSMSSASSSSNSNNSTSSNTGSGVIRVQGKGPAFQSPWSHANDPEAVFGTGKILKPDVPSGATTATLKKLQINQSRQTGNGLIKHIRNVAYEYCDNMMPDYIMGHSACALFLSLKYHCLHPDYIYGRINSLRNRFTLTILLCSVDIESNNQPILELSQLAMNTGVTLILTWSPKESARYLETYKMYENKTPTFIKEKVDDDHYSRATDVLTTIRGVNKTDVLTLTTTFGTMKNIMSCSMEELSFCPGLGERKVKRLLDTWNAPLDPNKKNVNKNNDNRASVGKAKQSSVTTSNKRRKTTK